MRACPHLQSHVVCNEWVLWRNPRGLGHALTLFHSIFTSSSLWTVKANCLSLELPSIHSFQSVGRGRRRRNKSQSGWPSVTENLLSLKEKKKMQLSWSQPDRWLCPPLLWYFPITAGCSGLIVTIRNSPAGQRIWSILGSVSTDSIHMINYTQPAGYISLSPDNKTMLDSIIKLLFFIQ